MRLNSCRIHADTMTRNRPITTFSGRSAGSVANVRNDTYERLKHSIVNHEYPPGAIVGISELARDFGVSRTPIREALNILERDFLVKLVDMRGALVLPLGVDDVLQLNQMREVIDGLAARLAAATMPDEEIDTFVERFQALGRTAAGTNSEEHEKLSAELHGAITAASRNRYVQSQSGHLDTAFQRAKKQAWGVWNRSAQRSDIGKRRLQEHLRILAALKKRDPAAAEQAAREHIVNATVDFLKISRPPAS
jgi:DNA-binding GntR family transcriptional regulator